MATNNNKNTNCVISESIKKDFKNIGTIKVNLRENHTLHAFRNFEIQFNTKLFCDFDLISALDQTKVSVHRNILAASSQYFSANIPGERNGKRHSKFIFTDVSGKVLKLIAKFCYTGDIEINYDDIEAILLAATKYQFIQIQEICTNIINRYLQMNPERCLAFYSLACSLKLSGLKELSKRLALNNFMKVKDTAEFLSLNYDALYELIESDELNVAREENVFSAISAWIYHDKANREQYSENIVKLIRFDQMKVTYIKQNVMELMTSANQTNLYKDILSYRYHPHMKPSWHKKSRQTTATKIILETRIRALIPETNSEIISREMYSESKESWKSFRTICTINPVTSIIQWNNSYLFAGKRGTIQCIDMTSLQSTLLLKMPTLRENYALLIHNDAIYVIAGNKYNPKTWLYDIPTELAEKYVLSTKLWYSCSFFIILKSEPIAVSTDNHIICADRITRFIEYYDLNLQKRNIIVYPQQDRDRISQMKVHNGQLYVASNRYIDKYNLLTETWTMVINCENKIISKSIQSNEIVRKLYKNNGQIELQKYCIDTEKWLSYGNLMGNYSIESKFFIFFNYIVKENR